MAFRKQSLTLILSALRPVAIPRERRSNHGSGARIFSKTSSGSTSAVMYLFGAKGARLMLAWGIAPGIDNSEDGSAEGAIHFQRH